MFYQIEKLINYFASRYYLDKQLREDMIQTAWLEVMERKAVWGKIPSEKICSYLSPFIRRSLMDYYYQNLTTVTYIKTKGEIKACNNLLSYISSSDELKPEIVDKMKKDLNISFSDVLAAAQFHFGKDETISWDEKHLPSECLESSLSHVSERIMALESLYREIEKLPLNNKRVIESRWLQDEKVSFSDVAKENGLSKAGVAYLESQAIDFIRKSDEFKGVTYSLNL